jgi:hypothetical protein
LVEPTDDFASGRLSLKTDFEVPAHGRLMGGELIVFKPVLVGRRSGLLLKPGERKSPVVFEAFSMEEVIEFELPEGFKVDDIPAPVDFESPFGRYKAHGRVDAGKLVFERIYFLKASVIPASDYGIVRDFFEKVIQAEQSPVVLARL